MKHTQTAYAHLILLLASAMALGCGDTVVEPPRDADMWNVDEPQPAPEESAGATAPPEESTSPPPEEPNPTPDPADTFTRDNGLAMPPPSSSCPEGLPWHVTTHNATVTHVDGGSEQGAIEISLDGAEGGFAYLRLPVVRGEEVDISLQFSGLQESPWGTYEIYAVLHDPTYPLLGYNDREKFYLAMCRVSALHHQETTTGMSTRANSASIFEVRGAYFPTGGQLHTKRTAEGTSIADTSLTHDQTQSRTYEDVNTEVGLQYLIMVRGNMPSKGAVVRLESVRAKSSDGLLRDDNFSCADLTMERYDPVLLYGSMVEGRGPRPVL